MKRSILIITTLALLASFATAEQKSRPNIIWLMSEDIGLDLELNGMAGVQTPNLNRLAEEGTTYTRAYCPNPICSPNRSAMMIGVHQTITNTHHHRSNRDLPLADPYKPITYWLRDAGYTCVLGSNLVKDIGAKTDCNFKHEPVGEYDGIEKFGLFDRIGDFTAADQPFFNQIQLRVTHRGDWWNEVREKSEDPVSLNKIQLPPYIADTPEIRYDWAAYLDTIEYMDHEIGLLMDRIEEEGIEENTIVIFIGDNGRCNLRGKGYLHETGIHVPMIIWAPGYLAAGSVVEELVSVTDISATILKLSGSQMPEYLTSRPLMSVEEPQYRKYVRSARDIWDEIDECSRSITTKRYKYIRNYMPEVPWATDQAYLELNRPALHIMRTLKANNKLTEAEMTHFQERKPFEELYDLEKDPHEMNNLASNPAYREILRELRGMESDWISNHRDLGLEDLGIRQPVLGLAAEQARKGVQEHEPELWERLQNGELLETHDWMRKYGK